LDLKYGSLLLTQLQLEAGNHASLTVLLDDKKELCTMAKDGMDTVLRFNKPLTMLAHQQLKIQLT
jgi:hypothetical protein